MTTPEPSPGDTLPYANPTPLAAVGDIFRDGATLVARDHLTLPPVCVLCGARAGDAQKPITLKFSWDPSFHVTYAKSTLELRRSSVIRAHLCPPHYKSWRVGRLLGIAGMIASTILMLAAAALAIISEASEIPRQTPLALSTLIIGFALFIVFLFIFTLTTRTLACIKIDQGYTHLTGADEKFLATLPPLPRE